MWCTVDRPCFPHAQGDRPSARMVSQPLAALCGLRRPVARRRARGPSWTPAGGPHRTWRRRRCRCRSPTGGGSPTKRCLLILCTNHRAVCICGLGRSAALQMLARATAIAALCALQPIPIRSSHFPLDSCRGSLAGPQAVVQALALGQGAVEGGAYSPKNMSTASSSTWACCPGVSGDWPMASWGQKAKALTMPCSMWAA